MILQMPKLHCFCGLIIFHWISVPCFLYSAISWWKFRLFPFFMNSAAINKELHMSLPNTYSIIFEYISNSEVAESYGSCYFSFLSIIIFSVITILVFTPNSSVKGFPLLHIFTNTWYLGIFVIFYTSNSY